MDYVYILMFMTHIYIVQPHKLHCQQEILIQKVPFLTRIYTFSILFKLHLSFWTHMLHSSIDLSKFCQLLISINTPFKQGCSLKNVPCHTVIIG